MVIQRENLLVNEAGNAVATWEDLQQLVLLLQSTHELPLRRELAAEIVDHPNFGTMLTHVCGVVLKGQARNTALFDDVRQEAVVILLERFGVGNLTYRDEGCDRFRNWVSAISCSACMDACRRLGRSCRRTALVDSAFLDRIPQESELNPADRLTEVLVAINGVEETLWRELLLEILAGLTLKQSAAKHGLSIGQVFRLRCEARRLLRRRIPD
jgi:DNA-directed RNA polymerase specialized sigma24 family protein